MTPRKHHLLGTALVALVLLPATLAVAAPADAQRQESGNSYGDPDRREHRRAGREARREQAQPDRGNRDARERRGRDRGDARRERRDPPPGTGRGDHRRDGQPGGQDRNRRGAGDHDRRDQAGDRNRNGRGPGWDNNRRDQRNWDNRRDQRDAERDRNGRNPGWDNNRRDQRDWDRRRDHRDAGRDRNGRNPAWDRRDQRRDYHDNRRDRRWDNDRGRRPGAHHDRRRWEYAQRRRDFYRDRARRQARLHWVHHMNRGWSNARYYGHWGPSDRWRYHRQYYSHGYEGRRFAYYDGLCRYDRNGSDGAIVGALLGALVGGAAAGDDSVGAGILLGAGFGAALGSSLDRMDNCDRAQYHYAMNYAFEYGEPYYWANPYSGVRGTIVVRETYYTAGRECRWGDAEIYMPDGTYNYDRVRMCRDGYGDWQVAHRQ